MVRPRTRNPRRRSARSWSFRSFKRAVTIVMAIVLASWIYSANHFAYYVGDHVTIGAAKGMFDIMLATGDEANFAYLTFEPGGLEDPSNFYRPKLNRRSEFVRPKGWSSGLFSDRMPFEEQLGLRMPYWRTQVNPALSFVSGGRAAGPATFRNWQIPCWLVALALLALCTFSFLLDRPLPAHLCVNCRYDLTGNTSGICSECGTAIRPSPEPHPSPGV